MGRSEYIQYKNDLRKGHKDGILKLLRSPGIDSKDSIPPAYVAWQPM
jgi:hypothetical protein